MNDTRKLESSVTRSPGLQVSHVIDWPCNAGLKVVVDAKATKTAIRRASYAAFVKRDGRKASPIQECLRLTASESVLILESAVPGFACRHVINESDGLVVIEQGSVCVPAASIKTVMSRIEDGHTVSIGFAPALQTPPIFKMQPITAVMPDGVVRIGVIKGTRASRGVVIDSYPVSSFKAFDFADPSSLIPVIDGDGALIGRAWDMVRFAINKNDMDIWSNNVAFFPAGNSLYILGSDGRRCTVMRLKSAVPSGSHTNFDVPLLVHAKYLALILAGIKAGEHVVMVTDPDDSDVYIIAGGSSYCIRMPCKDQRAKYPHYERLTGLDSGAVIIVSRDELLEVGDSIGVVNREHVRLSFHENDDAIEFKSVGIGALTEAVGTVNYSLVSEQVIKSGTMALHMRYLLDALEQMSGLNVKMSFTPDECRVKLEDPEAHDFAYYMQVLPPQSARNTNKVDMGQP